MMHIDYKTKNGNLYRIEYRLCGFFKWEWDILLWSPAPDKSDWLGLTFGWERTVSPKRIMEEILRNYAEYKDRQNE